MIDLKYKAKVKYSTETSNWNCFYHALSGDELKSQIMSIFYKPTNQENSWSFSDLSAPYKMYDEQGILEWIKLNYKNISDNDLNECLIYILQFLNDAKLEYTGKPFKPI